MEHLMLNNGLILENASAIQSGDLFLYIPGYSLSDVFNLLIDPNNVSKIVYKRMNGTDVIYSNYMHLIAVREENNLMITAVLRKGE